MVYPSFIWGSCQTLARHGSSDNNDTCQQKGGLWFRVQNRKGVYESEETNSMYYVNVNKRSDLQTEAGMNLIYVVPVILDITVSTVERDML